jgi:uncharacterized membrane protein
MIDIGFFLIGFGILIILLQKRINNNKFQKILNSNAILNFFFVVYMATILLSSINNLLSQKIFTIPIGCMYFAFTIVLIHASLTIGKKNTLIFFSISLFAGFFSEFLGVKYGLIFGQYYYNMNTFFFGMVPLTTPISWAIIIYMSYGITNIFFHYAGGDIINFKQNWLFLGIVIFIQSSIDGLCAMNLDMIMDPIAVLPSVSSWVWIGGGPYFNVPISNFIGWFFVTFLVTFIFRVYKFISNSHIFLKDNVLWAYMPILYLFYFIDQSTFAFKNGINLDIILIGVATMFPFIMLSLLVILIKNWRINIEN